MAQVLNVAGLTLAIKTEVEFEELFFCLLFCLSHSVALCKKHAHETRERVFAPFLEELKRKTRPRGSSCRLLMKVNFEHRFG